MGEADLAKPPELVPAAGDMKSGWELAAWAWASAAATLRPEDLPAAAALRPSTPDRAGTGWCAAWPVKEEEEEEEEEEMVIE